MTQGAQSKDQEKKKETEPVCKESFPGRDVPGREVPLRVNIGAVPWAEVLAHAAETPEIEICGVLVGRLCQDAKGQHVRVTGAIRGERARERGAHVTFTHETWDHIHRQLDTHFPGENIVGWYHTHPDFGVFLSDMDSFIHTNFFGQPHHVALVRDPIRGQSALFILRGKELVALDHFWRDTEPVSLDRPNEAMATLATSPQLEEMRELLFKLSRDVDRLQRKGWSDWLVLVFLGGILCLLLLGFLLAGPRERESLRGLGSGFQYGVVDPSSGRVLMFGPSQVAPNTEKGLGGATSVSGSPHGETLKQQSGTTAPSPEKESLGGGVTPGQPSLESPKPLRQGEGGKP